jgi:hypothetical protein
MQGHGDPIRRDVDPLDQQPEDLRLLGRVELVPNRLERAQRLDHLTFFELRVLGGAVLPAHRGDGARDHLG